MRSDFDNQAMYLYFIHAISFLVPRHARLDWRREWEAEILNHLMVLQKRNRLNFKSKIDLWVKVAGASFDVATFENNKTRFALIGLNSLVAMTMGFAAIREFSFRNLREGQLQPVFLSSAVIVVCVLFIISAVAILREWSAERSLVIITGVLSVLVHVYGTLPPHRNMGYVALLIGAGYGLVMLLIYQRMKFILLVMLVLTAPLSVVSQTPRPDAEVLRTEQEQRDAYLKRDVAKTERLIADEFILTSGRNVRDKASLLDFLKTAPIDPTLTLTTEDTRVVVDGDTAIVIGRRVERRRREDNNREGVAYARYIRTYIKRQERWQLLAEHLEAIPAERTAVKIDPKIYDDYVGEYESAIFDFAVVKDGERLMAIPKERTATRTSAGRPPGELLPESEAEFFLKGRDAQVIFMRNRKGEVTHAIMRINGADIRATRKK